MSVRSTRVDARLLRTLHRMLKQQTDLRSRLERGPRKIALAQGSEATFQDSLDQLKTELTQTKMAADAKQLQLKEREAKIENLKTKLNVCESNREYQLLNDQIAADKQANSVLSDEILEQLDRIDQTEAAIEQAKQNLAKAEAETKRVSEVIEAELASVQADLDSVNAEMAEHERELPGDLRGELKRLVSGMGEDALAAVDDSTCGNCNTILSTQVVSELTLSTVVFCKSCGSLLYFPENATV